MPREGGESSNDQAVGVYWIARVKPGDDNREEMLQFGTECALALLNCLPERTNRYVGPIQPIEFQQNSLCVL